MLGWAGSREFDVGTMQARGGRYRKTPVIRRMIMDTTTSTTNVARKTISKVVIQSHPVM